MFLGDDINVKMWDIHAIPPKKMQFFCSSFTLQYENERKTLTLFVDFGITMCYQALFFFQCGSILQKSIK